MKKVFTVSVLFLVAALIAGFTFNDKGKTDDPTSTAAPYVYTNTDNLIVGAKYNPNNVMAIWTESFDGTFPPAGWLNLLETGTYYWTQASVSRYPAGFPTHSGAGMAEYRSFTATTGMGASLISSVFSLTGGAAKIGFWMLRDGVSYQTNADLVNFMINTTASSTGATLLGTINRARALAPVEPGPDGWYYYEFSIPVSFNTATNYLILKSVSAYGNDMYVDDVNVSYLLANDVGMVSVDIATPIPPGALTPKATVKNFGSAVQTFPVTMSITPGGYTNTQTVTALAGGASLQVSFGSWAPTSGTYSVKVITQLGTDQDRTNDTLIKSINVSSSGWTSGALCPAPNSLGAGVGYARNDTGWVFSIGGQANLTPVTKYNIKTNVWTTVAPLPIGLDRFGACRVKDSIYVIGGAINATAYGAQVYKYDINANTWVTRTSLPGVIGWNKVIGYQDSLIYCAGGYNGVATVSDVLLYNAKTNTWRTATSMPAIRFGGGFAVVGDTLIYASGVDGTVIQPTTYRGVISQTDRSAITWTTGAPIPTALFRTDAAQFGCGIILATGSSTTAWTSVSNQAYFYSPGLNTWTLLATMPTALTASHLGSAYIGQNKWKFVVATGYTGTVAYGTPQIYSDSIGCLLVGVTGNSSVIPTVYSLSQNYPNPFNPVTKISYGLPKSGLVTLRIFDMLGREVASLINEFKAAGTYTVDFNASQLSSGVYFYKIETNGFTDIKKMMLIK